jgi:hypothetical protein
MLTSVALRGVCRVLVIMCAVSCVAQTISFDGPRLSVPDSAKVGVLVSGDWNGDGRLDIATVGDNYELLIFEGDGVGGFKRVSELPLPALVDRNRIMPYGIPIRIGAADFNGDGKSDLIAFFGQGEFATFLNEGGQFRVAPPIYFRPQVADVPPGGPTILGFAFSDFNRDGKTDLLLLLNGVGREPVMLSNGDGTFSKPLIGPRTFNFVGVADFNQDGWPDVMTEEFGSGGSGVWLHIGRGDGTFEAPVSAGICSTSCSINVVEVNGDGVPDLLVSDRAWGSVGNSRVFRGNGFELLARLDDSFLGDDRESYTAVFVDLNADGIPDLIKIRNGYVVEGAAENRIRVYSGDGSGNFTPSTELPVAATANVLIVDVNDDGKPDLVVTDGTSGLAIFLNTSAGGLV